MTEEPADTTPAPTPLKRLLHWVFGGLAVAVLALLAVHVMIQPVSPAQGAPAGHFGGPCLLCHIVTEGTDVIDLGN